MPLSASKALALPVAAALLLALFSAEASAQHASRLPAVGPYAPSPTWQRVTPVQQATQLNDAYESPPPEVPWHTTFGPPQLPGAHDSLPEFDSFHQFEDESSEVRPASLSNGLDPQLGRDDELGVRTGQQAPGKPGVFQLFAFTGTWLYPTSSSDLGVTELQTYAVFGFPLPTRESPLLITPGAAVQFFDGPDGIDLPGTVYDSYVQFRWLRKINDCWGMDLSVAPGLYGDYKEFDSATLRITGAAVLAYDWTPNLKLVAGVAYLDRDDIDVMPVGGLIWTPIEDFRLEAIAPRPRIAYRYLTVGDTEHWAYLAGEFGGGSWAVDQAGGTRGQVSMRDYRMLVGLERKRPDGGGCRVEAGWVFGRVTEFSSGQPDYDANDTFLVRAGATY